MKLIVNRQIFAAALSEVLPFAPQKAPIPILRYAKITTKGNRMRIEANDQMASIRKYIELVECDEDSTALIDIASMAKYIAKVKSDMITLHSNGEGISIKHDKGSASNAILPVDGYPDFIMDSTETTTVHVPSDVLRKFIDAASNFVDYNDLHPQMKPIYAYINDGFFGVTATDTRALINDKVQIPALDGVEVNWFIEPFTFSAIKCACKNVESVEIVLSKNKVSYKLGSTLILSTQTNGIFPPFERVIPKDWALECSINRTELLDAINRVALMSNDVKCVKFNFSQMELSLSAEDLTTFRKSSESIMHNGCNGEYKTAFKAEFICRCLSACPSKEVSLRMTENRPILIADEAEPNRLIVCMPMFIN